MGSFLLVCHDQTKSMREKDVLTLLVKQVTKFHIFIAIKQVRKIHIFMAIIDS